MSVWSEIAALLGRLARGEGLLALFERLRTPPEQSVGFAIAVIALGAKIAKADGRVTRGEVTAFREVFVIPEAEEANAARVYDLARQDTAGYEDYARRIAAMFHGRPEPLADLLEGLFHVAMSDGAYDAEEDAFLASVAGIFAIPEPQFQRIRAKFVPDAERDPHDILGLPQGATLDEGRSAWRALVRDGHPDRMIARGLPEEAVRLAEKRLIAINDAWERFQNNALRAPA